MNDTASPVSWLDANQRYLCAELARIKALLATHAEGDDRDASLRAAAREIDAVRRNLPVEAPIDLVTTIFGLTPFERDILLLTGGVELDSALAGACAAATGGTTPGLPTLSIALAVLPKAHWSALSPDRPLRRWRLIEIDSGLPLTLAPLRIDERILHFLAGINVLDARLRPLVTPLSAPALVAPGHRATADRVAAALHAYERAPAVQLYGDDPDGQEDVAALVAAEFGWKLHAVRTAELPAGKPERAALATLWTREAALLDAALLINASAGTQPTAIAELVEAIEGPVFLTAREPIAVRREMCRYPVSVPDRAAQRALWREALGSSTAACAASVEMLASQVRLSARAIARLAPEVRAGRDVRAALLEAGSRSCGALDVLAMRIEPHATWDDLVVPAPIRTLLEEIAVHARHRGTVYDDWGFGVRASRGLGVTALFVGESGTGKTMAAEVLANELGLDLYRIDLATVVSKYIGETEKNLRRVFDAAEDSGVILLFDEADALFGKRSDVKDSHDRYANIEVSYLLQRMEAYCGLAILTTNMKGALDRAFQRRLRFVVQFPFPDAAQRAAIWRKAFPAGTPTAELDFQRLARLGVAGGTIDNIALRAAFRAARSQVPVNMMHIISAARDEYAQLERTLNTVELQGQP